MIEHAPQIFATFAFILVLAVFANILQQVLIRRSHEPPVVFHWVPIIGSTVTYGMDPFKFFADCQARVNIGIFNSPP